MSKKRVETIDDICEELRMGYNGNDIDGYLMDVASRIELANTNDVIKAMDDLMHG